MPLTLVTGPANAAKAQVVLERFRAALPREPILVVPRSTDAEHYRRELAVAGVIVGARVEAFSGLMREIAARAGLAHRPLGEHARAAVARAAIAQTRLDALAPAARSPAFAPALARFLGELAARRIEPPRFTAAMRAWAGETRRRGHAEELAALYTAYRARLARLGRNDRELHDRAALDAITLAPDRWRATPVFCYGFDDLDALQLATIETLASRVDAPVTVSLPGEPGRVALAGRAGTLEALRPFAVETIELPPSAAYYEEPALHHLERTLFEDAGRVAPGTAVRLLEGGDERAEAELVAAQAAELIAAGFAPADIAIVTRAGADLLADALSAAGVPHSLDRRDRLDASVTGRALLAAVRVAANEADVEDLVMRAAGHTVAGPKDAFEARLRRRGITDLRGARALWERDHGPLELPDGIDALERELDRLLAAGAERAAALLDPWEGAAAAAARRALAELRELERTDQHAVGGLAGIAAALEAVTVELAQPSGGVTICDPLSLRARRVRALFIYGAQEGVFPASAREESFLGSAERGELRLPFGPVTDQLAAERYLFYALCSRPTARLFVSWHEAGDAGDQTPRSLFVDELCDCFEAALFDQRATRPAGALGWPGDEHSVALAKPRRRAGVLAPLADPGRLLTLRARRSHSASGLECWARCPVAWLVEHGLRPRELSPDPIWLRRGSESHRVLASVFAALDGERLDPGRLPRALELMDAALEERVERLSPHDAMDRAERRRLRAELARYLDYAAALAGEHAPAALELGFGLEEGEPEAVELDPALALCGRIDRIDVDPAAGTAIVYDYKSGATVWGAASWPRDLKLQAALYMLAVERLLGLEAVGGLYQPLRADLRARGLIREDLAEAEGLSNPDRVSGPALREVLEERLAAAVAIAAEIDRGELEPRPATCHWREGCSYPAICRVGAA
jgi:ATP-dependent helicase/DNAse subunit B